MVSLYNHLRLAFKRLSDGLQHSAGNWSCQRFLSSQCNFSITKRHASRFMALDDGSSHLSCRLKKKTKPKNMDPFVSKPDRLVGTVCFLSFFFTAHTFIKQWISRRRITTGLLAQSATLNIISHIHRGANWVCISIYCNLGLVKLVPREERRLKLLISIL